MWAFGGGNTGPIAVCVTAPSNCAAPTGPSAANITNTTAQLSWVAPTTTSPGNTYELEYGIQGFVQGAGTMVAGLTTTTYGLINLTPNSTYCFYVRQNCGGFNGSSTYAGPFCFSTPLTAPANDEPCGALLLGATPLSSSNVGATTTVQPTILTPACSPASLPKDVWFAFTPTGPTAAFALTGPAAGMVRLFTTASCATGPFTQVFCRSSLANNTSVGAFTVAGLTPGTTYYVAVSGYGSSDTPGAFTISAATVLAARAAADAEALRVYPNPSSTGQLTLALRGLAGPGQLALYNALGQRVATQPVAAAPELNLSTRGLAAGVYTLRLTVQGQTFTRKVVLE